MNNIEKNKDLQANNGIETRLDQNATPERILRSIATQFKELTSKADESLYQRMDANEHKRFLKERAKLIVDLPSKIQACVKIGKSFPESKMNDLHFMSQSANEALEDGGRIFMLGVLLIDREMKKGDSNNLEKLIDDIYPKQEVSL